MKLRSVLFCSVLAVTGVSPLLLAEEAAPAPAKEDTTELGTKMSALSKAFKKLRLQVADPAKNEDSLKLAAIIHENAEASLKLVPEKAADLPAADQEKFKADFVAKMESLIGEVTKLEASLQAGNNDEAKKLLETLNTAQKEGHKEFRKKKPEKK